MTFLFIFLRLVINILFIYSIIFFLLLVYLSHEFIILLIFSHLLKLIGINKLVAEMLLACINLWCFSSNLLQFLSYSLLTFKILLNLFQCILLYFFLLLKVWVAFLSVVYIVVLKCHFSSHYRSWFPKRIFWFDFSKIWI